LNRRQKGEVAEARQGMEVKDDNNKGREEQIGKRNKLKKQHYLNDCANI